MQCPCERAFRIKDELAGKKIRCPACKQVLVVPKPEPQISPEEEAFGVLLIEEAPTTNQKGAKARAEDDERVTAKAPPWSKPTRERDDEEDDEREEAPWSKPKTKTAEKERRE